MRGYITQYGCCAPIHKVDKSICRFSQVQVWQVFLIHYGPCYLEDVPILSFSYSILLRCVSAGKLSPDSLLSKICCKGVEKVLFATVRLKASDMPTGCLFNFILELLEVYEHFALLSHTVDPGMSREVVDECHVVSATTECCHLGWSPYI